MGDLFKEKSAWFSNSVKKRRKETWVQEGGIFADRNTAKFLFSEDSMAEDTQWIFSSTLYSDNAIAVFHASYIDACCREKSLNDVVLGKYFLPPAEMYELTRMQGGFEWEKQQDIPTEDNKTEGTDNEPDRSSTHKRHSSECVKCLESRNATKQNFPHIDDLPAVTGELVDFIPGQHGFTVRHVR
ncbi:telomere repeats-binding bouquet formation protein 2-like [Saccoglossus kowalevskii]|uniref:Uncharacterized protein C15orf43 homolog n=1 Tax=Saccoglossus kowalevskii TaxID=10224 RepID=A0ABM0GIR2_SACKO|nr:PREDICTED: uncharacterized protein C15orf43 homolog [Saccoglossus kowalevskii]